jgi:hypothetical protein
MARMTATLRVDNASKESRNNNDDTMLLAVRVPRTLREDIGLVAEEYGSTIRDLVTDILTNGVREYIEGKTVVAELTAVCEVFFSRYGNGSRRDGVREKAAEVIKALIGMSPEKGK